MVPGPYGPQVPQLPDFCGNESNSLKGSRKNGSPEGTPGTAVSGSSQRGEDATLRYTLILLLKAQKLCHFKLINSRSGLCVSVGWCIALRRVQRDSTGDTQASCRGNLSCYHLESSDVKALGHYPQLGPQGAYIPNPSLSDGLQHISFCSYQILFPTVAADALTKPEFHHMSFQIIVGVSSEQPS